MDRRWLGAAAVVILAVGGARVLDSRDGIRHFADEHVELGNDAKGTMLAIGLGPEVIPDDAPITFFGIFGHGTAGQVRSLIARYGSPFEATAETADQQLVDLGIARARLSVRREYPGCEQLPTPLLSPGSPLWLWSSEPFTVEIRRYGDDWLHLADVPAGRLLISTLPTLDTALPWQIKADGACRVGP